MYHFEEKTNWGGSATYNSDGSMNLVWSGIAEKDGKQNQYAYKFLYNGDIARATIETAQRKGQTIEYTIEVISSKAKDASGNSLSSVQVLYAFGGRNRLSTMI